MKLLWCSALIYLTDFDMKCDFFLSNLLFHLLFLLRPSSCLGEVLCLFCFVFSSKYFRVGVDLVTLKMRREKNQRIKINYKAEPVKSV